MIASITTGQTSKRCKLFMLFMVAAGLVYVWLGFNIQNNAHSRGIVKNNYNGKLTVVINTFKRNDMMLGRSDTETMVDCLACIAVCILCIHPFVYYALLFVKINTLYLSAF